MVPSLDPPQAFLVGHFVAETGCLRHCSATAYRLRRKKWEWVTIGKEKRKRVLLGLGRWFCISASFGIEVAIVGHPFF